MSNKRKDIIEYFEYNEIPAEFTALEIGITLFLIQFTYVTSIYSLFSYLGADINYIYFWEIYLTEPKGIVWFITSMLCCTISCMRIIKYGYFKNLIC